MTGHYPSQSPSLEHLQGQQDGPDQQNHQVTLVLTCLQVADLKTYGSSANPVANYYKFAFPSICHAIFQENYFLKMKLIHTFSN
jgi:hypothetical protein